MKTPEIEPHGPLMIDIASPELTAPERARLLHPLVGGLILFARNYQSPEQLIKLTSEVRALRSPPLLIAIDQEGGRVQRCREGFTRLPPMRHLGFLWDSTPEEAISAAHSIGFVLAAELRQCGVDMSFAPVLDLDWGRSSVIGNRSFHRDPAVVARLAGALIEGQRKAGMPACGKHFPGHGWSEVDSHVAIPVDERGLDALSADIEPYRRLKLDAVMLAHVIYPEVDPLPAGFSRTWVDKLRNELGFKGALFCDDLSMEGASIAGDIVGRVSAAWHAGCDMLPICNAPDAVEEVLRRWNPNPDPGRSGRIARILPISEQTGLRDNPLYCAGVKASGLLLS